jgi:bifunctional enzyme CysN/CysC
METTIDPAAGSGRDAAGPPDSDGLLRFITCGSVDDGKSTLIGRLLYDSKLIFDDQLAAVTRDSKHAGTRGGDLDLALLVDGLAAEREQGITIDVAHRFFSTPRRKYIVADSPGHEQYTRNMATAASTADLAIILVDARKGVLTQTRRHSYIAALLGLRSVVLAVNKMDAVDYSERVFRDIENAYRSFAALIGLDSVTAIPLSALEGDNVTSASASMPWYRGTTLMGHLESVPIGSALQQRPLRFPVQWVNRPDQDFRGYAGLVVSGTVARGDAVKVMPSARTSRIARVVTADGDLERAIAGQSVTLTLDDEVDVSRGDVIARADAAPAVSDQFQTTIIWMDEEPLLPGRAYFMKIGTAIVSASITELQYKVDINTLEHIAAKQLSLNEVGVCNVATDRAVAFDAYTENRSTGGFILIDKFSNHTVGAGMIRFGLRRADNLHWQAVDVLKHARAAAKRQRPCVLWFTGLSGAGKSTIANLVEKRLHVLGRHTYLLDGDNVRHGLNKDLGFTDADRVENIRRIGEVAKLMVDAGLIVLVSFISPFRAERRMARELVEPGEFIEIFVDTPLAEAERRDVKGLYRKARRGELPHFTGVDSPYEEPENPEIRIDTTAVSPELASERIVRYLDDAS